MPGPTDLTAPIPPQTDTGQPPSFAELFQAFLRIGLLSFGGPAAQISLMHRTLVDEKRWLSEEQYLSALGFCMLLPGPEAMQLCTYAGWRLRGIPGGVLAGGLFVLPGAMVIFAIATLYASYGSVPWVQTAFLGVKAAVLIIVVEALHKVSKRALKGRAQVIIAGLAFAGIFVFDLPFPLLIGAAAIYGYWVTPASGANTAPAATPISRTVMILAAGLAIWLVPLAFLPAGLLQDIGLFFSWLAVVTFGGAYAVLAYMAQAMVTEYAWITPDQMIDGLGLAETTPGPLILVTQFVAYLAGDNAGGTQTALLAALVALWVTFVPCFLWIFAGAPYIERLSANARLSGALAAVTAAVVGVILNLSVYFALHVLFAEVPRLEIGPLSVWWPQFTTINPAVVLLSGLAAVMLLWRGIGLGWTLLACAGAALALSALI